MFKKLIVAIAKAFSHSNIPYIILGGQAVLLYGEPRLTKDIDITIGLNIDAVDKIAAILKKIGVVPIPGDFQQFVKRTMVLPLINKESGIRVDIIFSFSEFERSAIKRANIVKIDDTDVHYVSLEDLIVFKVFSGRPRDREDVRLILIKNKKMDLSYVRKKLKELSFEDNDFLKTFNEIFKSV
ncbi:MAG: nucleotidyltransferase family protein [bacterium]|nr:nucleotidyltransferase family protein [bacterium]